MDNHKAFNNYKENNNNYPMVEDNHSNDNSKNYYKETDDHYNDNNNKNISRSNFAIGKFHRTQPNDNSDNGENVMLVTL